MPIEHIWEEELQIGFEVHQFASRVLEKAMEDLESDGYLESAVFFITSTHLYCYGVTFKGYEEKEATYAEVVRLARELKAVAIVTLNDAYTGEPGTFDPDKYQWGDLAKNHSAECIFVSVSGPGLENWSKEVQYKRDGGTFLFAEPEIERKSLLGILQDWALGGQRVN